MKLFGALLALAVALLLLNGCLKQETSSSENLEKLWNVTEGAGEPTKGPTELYLDFSPSLSCPNPSASSGTRTYICDCKMETNGQAPISIYFTLLPTGTVTNPLYSISCKDNYYTNLSSDELSSNLDAHYDSTTDDIEIDDGGNMYMHVYWLTDASSNSKAQKHSFLTNVSKGDDIRLVADIYFRNQSQLPSGISCYYNITSLDLRTSDSVWIRYAYGYGG